jgi:hypothetical protein
MAERKLIKASRELLELENECRAAELLAKVEEDSALGKIK